MMQIHGYSLRELEDMIPFEREIYLAMLAKYIKDETERIKNARRK